MAALHISVFFASGDCVSFVLVDRVECCTLTAPRNTPLATDADARRTAVTGVPCCVGESSVPTPAYVYLRVAMLCVGLIGYPDEFDNPLQSGRRMVLFCTNCVTASTFHAYFYYCQGLLFCRITIFSKKIAAKNGLDFARDPAINCRVSRVFLAAQFSYNPQRFLS